MTMNFGDISQEEIDFLRESNYIEQEYSSQAMLDAVKAWTYFKKQKKITLFNLRRMHRILSINSYLKMKYKGRFRDCQVYIGGREAIPYYYIEDALSPLLEEVNEKRNEEEIKENHIEYERIHPFIDFNGRTGRILLNWQRLKSNLPILVIKEKEKYEYYEWFR